MTMANCINHTSELTQKWMKASIMLGYSMPYTQTDTFPSHWLQKIYFNCSLPLWGIPKKGMYDYIDKIITLNQNHLTTHCDVIIKHVIRNNNKVSIIFSDGTKKTVDKVIIATTPGEVLSLLRDPTEAEVKRFSNWKDTTLHTTSHSDLSLYQPFYNPSPSPFDYFEKEDNDFGYNIYLNDIYKIKEPTSYCFAYNLDEKIAKGKIIKKISHTVPIINNKSVKYNEEIIQTNGENNTFFMGAYLGFGTQESAAKIAHLTAKKLDGM